MTDDQPIRQYKVASLVLPDLDPEILDSYEEAETRAAENSIDDDVWGIWDITGNSLEALAYQGRIYTT